MIKGERMAAQTAGLCVLSICLVLVWFQSNAVDPSYHRSRSDPDEASGALLMGDRGDRGLGRVVF